MKLPSAPLLSITIAVLPQIVTGILSTFPKAYMPFDVRET